MLLGHIRGRLAEPINCNIVSAGRSIGHAGTLLVQIHGIEDAFDFEVWPHRVFRLILSLLAVNLSHVILEL